LLGSISIPISNWNVGRVTRMTSMFYYASSFNSNISNWNVSSVTDMEGMFSGATSFNSDISNWNVSAVTTMYDMFYQASSFNSDISNWNVSAVTDMVAMFREASSFNSNISNWDVGRLTNLFKMFQMFNQASSFNQNLCPWGSKLPSNFDYASNTYNIFTLSGCVDKNNPTGPTRPWCAVTTCPNLSPTASPTQYCFPNRATLKAAVDKYINEGCETTNTSCATRSQYGVIGTWCVKHVTSMSEMFYGKSSFNSDISNWNVSAVTTMSTCLMGHQASTLIFQIGMLGV
jgi:surface protein